MSILDILSSIWIEAIASLIVFLFGGLASRIPNVITRRRLKAFFGSAVMSDNFKIVQGFYSAIEGDESNPTWTKCLKKFHVRPDLEVGVPSSFSSKHEIRASSYIVQELARYRKHPFPILTDDEAYKDLNNTFITVGGPLINEITYIALEDTNNRFLEMVICEPLDNPNVFHVIEQNNNRRHFERTASKDYGFLLKIRSTRFPEQFFFVCAGIGGWGTGGLHGICPISGRSYIKNSKLKNF